MEGRNVSSGESILEIVPGKAGYRKCLACGKVVKAGFGARAHWGMHQRKLDAAREAAERIEKRFDAMPEWKKGTIEFAPKESE